MHQISRFGAPRPGYSLRHTSTPIAQATQGSMLFPDGFGIDFTVRVRKVVRPLADSIFGPSFLNAFNHQIAVAERKKTKNIPE